MDEEATVWNEYKSSVKLGCPHPAEVVEPTSLAAIRLPELVYPIDETLGKVCRENKLSQLQMEGVSYACQKHTHILPNGSRCGFFLGDSAGMGKGRQLAAIIFDNLCRGRLKHVWFSTSGDLVKDARRDLQDIGCTVPVHDGIQSFDKRQSKGLGLDASAKRGVLFSTYTSLVSVSGSRSRFEQICKWLGDESFDGCILFDECHKAKNFAESEDNGSKVAKSVLEIQRRFPKARCIYASATGVTDIGNLAYMDRLGLWGKGAVFQTFDDFKTSMGKRNMGSLEMLAMELKSTGMHVSRALSYRLATFETLQAKLSKEHCMIYREAAAFWIHLHGVLIKAGKIAGKKPPWRTFWSAHQRFFKLLCVAFKVDTVVDLAKKSVEQGCAVVIGLQSTGEAALDFWLKRFGPRGDSQQPTSAATDALHVDPCFVNNLTLLQAIENNFPTLDLSPSDKEALERLENVASTLQNPVYLFDPENEKNLTPLQLTKLKLHQLHVLKQEILQRAAALVLPCNAIDDLIFRLGGSKNVAEMTGRRIRIEVGKALVAPEDTLASLSSTCTVRPRDKSTLFDVENDSSESLNLWEKKLFMDGEKMIAIISDAASTGISLHAERRAKNQRKRIHITCELPWAADSAVQQLGRSHRSSQVCAPAYKLISSGIGGETRFVSAVASRLQSLGALTHGDRRASNTGMQLGDFVYNSKYGKQALAMVLSSVQQKKVVEGVDYKKVLQLSSEQISLASEDACAHLQSTPDSPQLPDVDMCFWYGKRPILTELEFVECVTEGLLLALEGANYYELCFGSNSSATFADRDKNNVSKFFNRLLGLPIHLQGILFNYFCCTLDAVVQQAKDEGLYDEGISDLKANSVTLAGNPEKLFTNVSTGGELLAYPLRLDRGVSFQQAVQLLEAAVRRFQTTPQAPSDLPEEASPEEIDKASARLKVGGFFRSRKDMPGVGQMYLLALRKGPDVPSFVLYRPNTGRSLADKTAAELHAAYERVDLSEMKPSWEAFHEKTLTYCQHGPNCKSGDECLSGRRISDVYLLSGCVVPLWNHLGDCLNASTLPKAERVLRIVRAETDDGQRLVGIRWPHAAFEDLRKRLNSLSLAKRDVFLPCENGKPVGFSLASGSPTLCNVLEQATRVGLHNGDVLVAVNDMPLSGKTGRQAAELIRTCRWTCDVLKLSVQDTTKLNAAQDELTFESHTPVVASGMEYATREEKNILSFFQKRPREETSSKASKARKAPTRTLKVTERQEQELNKDAQQVRHHKMEKMPLIEEDNGKGKINYVSLCDLVDESCHAATSTTSEVEVLSMDDFLSKSGATDESSLRALSQRSKRKSRGGLKQFLVPTETVVRRVRGASAVQSSSEDKKQDGQGGVNHAIEIE